MQQGAPSQGAGASPGGGGGRGGAGEAAERVDTDETVEALKQQIKEVAKLVKSLNEISAGVRKGEVDPELLGRLNISGEALRRAAGRPFEKDKTEGKEIGVLSRDPEGEKGDQDPERDGGEKIHKTDVKAEVVDSPELRAGDLSPDKIRELIESGKVPVSPEYRRLVDRYFGELSEK